MENDLISVVVPVYNVKPYLERCVNGILNQTYKLLEIILVDDGSTDGSGDLCESFKSVDNRVRVIHKQNAGLGYARNSGLEICTGKYVAFVDSDDEVTSTLISDLYVGLTSNKVDECKLGYNRIDVNSKVCGEKKYPFEMFVGDKAKNVFAPRLIGSAPDKKDSIEMSVWGCLFNLAIIREYNVKFPSERELISEDIIFQLEYLQHANGACTIEAIDYKYRINEKSLTQSYRADRLEKCIVIYDELQRRLKLYGYDDDALNRAKRMFCVYIRMCIAQELKNNRSIAVANIKSICNNPRVREVVESYPQRQLGVAQRTFLSLVKHKCAFLLWALKKIKFY